MTNKFDYFIALKQFVKAKFDLIDNEKLKNNILNALPFYIGAFVVGMVAVAYAKLFGYAEQLTHYIFKHGEWAFFIVTPVGFLLAWYLVSKFAPLARGSGIPQVTAAIELANPKHNDRVGFLLGLRIIIIKIASSLLMVLSGGIIGREGPTIQISASIFKIINDYLPEWYPKIAKRNMIITGAAAGLAAAFNTPLGGIVFAIEELTKTHFSFFKSALLTGVIIAGLTALNFFGPYLYLGFPKLQVENYSIMVYVIPLAIITGIAGSGMGQTILKILKAKNESKFKYKNVVYIIISGLLIASFAYFVNPVIFGSGKELMVQTLFTDQKELAWYVPIVKFFGAVLSFTVGASGGVFAPSLGIGAAIGSVFAELFSIGASEVNLLILCGMTGFLTGITRSPFTSSILVLEMTSSHTVIFYIMLTALFANIVASVISKHSFYDYLKLQYIQEAHLSGEADEAKEE